jgi:hypothetical protein
MSPLLFFRPKCPKPKGALGDREDLSGFPKVRVKAREVGQLRPKIWHSIFQPPELTRVAFGGGTDGDPDGYLQRERVVIPYIPQQS